MFPEQKEIPMLTLESIHFKRGSIKNGRITNAYSSDLSITEVGNIHQLLVFVSEVLLEHDHSRLFTLCSNGRGSMVHKPTVFAMWPFKSADRSLMEDRILLVLSLYSTNEGTELEHQKVQT